MVVKAKGGKVQLQGALLGGGLAVGIITIIVGVIILIWPRIIAYIIGIYLIIVGIVALVSVLR